jgi:hypothetical protein
LHLSVLLSTHSNQFNHLHSLQKLFQILFFVWIVIGWVRIFTTHSLSLLLHFPLSLFSTQQWE